jgi:hypothetical protein
MPFHRDMQRLSLVAREVENGEPHRIPHPIHPLINILCDLSKITFYISKGYF